MNGNGKTCAGTVNLTPLFTLDLYFPCPVGFIQLQMLPAIDMKFPFILLAWSEFEKLLMLPHESLFRDEHATRSCKHLFVAMKIRSGCF
jgi:hypothetical protein